MSDLRDEIHDKTVTAEEQVFLDYHGRSPWALAKVAAGLRLFPESIAYMQRELAERKRAEAVRTENLKEDKADAPQQPPETPAPESVAERGPAADAVGGLPGTGSQGA
jgi:hypothetical protein